MRGRKPEARPIVAWNWGRDLHNARKARCGGEKKGARARAEKEAVKRGGRWTNKNAGSWERAPGLSNQVSSYLRARGGGGVAMAAFLREEKGCRNMADAGAAMPQGAGRPPRRRVK